MGKKHEVEIHGAQKMEKECLAKKIIILMNI